MSPRTMRPHLHLFRCLAVLLLLGNAVGGQQLEIRGDPTFSDAVRRIRISGMQGQANLESAAKDLALLLCFAYDYDEDVVRVDNAALNQIGIRGGVPKDNFNYHPRSTRERVNPGSSWKSVDVNRSMIEILPGELARTTQSDYFKVYEKYPYRDPEMKEELVAAITLLVKDGMSQEYRVSTCLLQNQQGEFIYFPIVGREFRAGQALALGAEDVSELPAELQEMARTIMPETSSAPASRTVELPGSQRLLRWALGGGIVLIAAGILLKLTRRRPA